MFIMIAEVSYYSDSWLSTYIDNEVCEIGKILLNLRQISNYNLVTP